MGKNSEFKLLNKEMYDPNDYYEDEAEAQAAEAEREEQDAQDYAEYCTKDN